MTSGGGDWIGGGGVPGPGGQEENAAGWNGGGPGWNGGEGVRAAGYRGIGTADETSRDGDDLTEPGRSGRHGTPDRQDTGGWQGMTEPHGRPAGPRRHAAPESHGELERYGQAGAFPGAEGFGHAGHGRHSAPDPHASNGSYGEGGSYGAGGSYGTGSHGTGSHGRDDAYGWQQSYGQGGQAAPPEPYGTGGWFGQAGADGQNGSYGGEDFRHLNGSQAGQDLPYQAGGRYGGAGSYGRNGSYPGQEPFHAAGEYGSQDSYQENGYYPGQAPYGRNGSYGGQEPYDPGAAGSGEPYGSRYSYDDPRGQGGSYGPPESYPAGGPAGAADPYGMTGSYGNSSGYAQGGSAADPDPYGPAQTYGQRGAPGADPYGHGGTYGPADPYGPGGSYGAADPYGPGGSYGAPGAYGSYGQPDSYRPGGLPDPYGAGAPAGMPGRPGAAGGFGGYGPGGSSWPDDHAGSLTGPPGADGYLIADEQPGQAGPDGWGGWTDGYGQPGRSGQAELNGRPAPRQIEAGPAQEPYAASGRQPPGYDGEPEPYPPSSHPPAAGEWPTETGGPFDPDPPPDAGEFADTDRYGAAGRRWDNGGYPRDEHDGDTGQYPLSGSFGEPDHGYLGAYRDMESRGPDDAEHPDDSGGPRGAGRAGPQYQAPGVLPDPDDGYPRWQDDPGDRDRWEDQDADDRWPDDVDGDDGLLSSIGPGAERKRSRRRGRRTRRLRGKAALTASVLTVALVLGVAASFGYDRVHSFLSNRYGDYQGPGTGTVVVIVPQGASLISLAPLLVKDGVIMAAHPFISAANAAANASNLQPGTYKLHHHMNAALACSLLLSGKAMIKDQVTIVEGVRASAIAGLLAKRTGYPAKDFLQIINHPPASLGLPSYANGRTEGYLFPDTYPILPKEKPLAILQAMVSEFKQQAASIGLVAAAAKGNLSPTHAIIIASLVQAEGNGTDFGKISRVIDNRLDKNMLLEFDSTVFYAMGKYGTAVSKAQESFPSPYNTYLHTGLPPGPIDNPGLAAIQAALHPPHGDWLYFITVNLHTGKTLFTASLAQLQQWQRQYQG